MTTTQEAPPPPDTRTPRPPSGPAFALLASVQVTLIYTLAALAVPLPHIGREFGLDRGDLILLSAAYGLTFAGLLLLGGRIADRYGGRRALAVGLSLFGAASAAAPLAPSFDALLGARFAQGVGAALVAPGAMAVLRTVFPAPAAYGKAMATWGGLSVLGATAGNLVAGVISALWSWRLAFVVPIVVAALALALAPRLLPTTAPGGGRNLDLRGAALATAGIIAASYGLVATDAFGWTSPRVWVPLTVGTVLIAAFLGVERRAGDPLLPPGFIRVGQRPLGLAATAVTAAGTASSFVLFSLHLQDGQDGRGWSALETSGAFVPYALALIASGRAASPLIGRYGAAAVTGGGLFTGATGLALLAATGFAPQHPYLYGLLPGLVLLAVGGALAFAGSAVLATAEVAPADAGLAGGVFNTAMESGATVLFAALIALGGSAASIAAAATLFAVLGALTTTSRLGARR
ncbi:MFS transporter [Streptomyces apocyni]|uniref:MFS transporter n=1 Tax=Streptomyces apocyni TaxID=2654677 RepID=UPI001E539495|nr:MFS transporter [Streptomyces apocyni]